MKYDTFPFIMKNMLVVLTPRNTVIVIYLYIIKNRTITARQQINNRMIVLIPHSILQYRTVWCSIVNYTICNSITVQHNIKYYIPRH